MEKPGRVLQQSVELDRRGGHRAVPARNGHPMELLRRTQPGYTFHVTLTNCQLTINVYNYLSSRIQRARSSCQEFLHPQSPLLHAQDGALSQSVRDHRLQDPHARQNGAFMIL